MKLYFLFIDEFLSRSAHGSCTYEHVTRTVTCRTRQLPSIPVGIATAALALHVEGRPGESLFTVVARSNFSSLQSLRELVLTRCGIEVIREGAFSELPTLLHLELRGNRLRTIHEDMFAGMAELEYLGLSDNPIHRLHNFAFRGMRVHTLTFDDVPSLVHIACKAFAGASVRSIVLSRCNLSTICSATFRSMRETLQNVQVTNNLQSLTVPDDVFDGMTLQSLTFSDNGIVDARFLEGLSAEHIRLDDNPLDQLDLEDSTDLANTRTLDLSNTRMTCFSKNDLAKLKHLESLNLSGNLMTVFNASEFSDNDNLVTLDLSGNRIAEFDGDFDDVLPNLEVLRLDGNDVTTLPVTIGSLFSRLRIVTLHDNPLHCNCEWRWFALWIDKHPDAVPGADKMHCHTPDVRNFTGVPIEELRCRKPRILSASYDDALGRLTCTAEGDPAPAVIWLASGKRPISESGPRQGVIVLTQGCIDVAKHDNYTCVASNAIGEDSVVVDTSATQQPCVKATTDDTSATSRMDLDVSRNIKILDTPLGFFVTLMLLGVLGYLFKYH